ncbi:cytochrome P450 [Russula decolorans]
MHSLLINAIDCLATSLFIYLLFVFRDRRRRGGLPYPPGPPPRPIIGNILDIPKDTPWITYVDMSKKYDDVISLRVFSEVVVVLNSLSALKDLLEKRGQIYSERPALPIAEMMDMNWPVFMTGMTETWRKGRKLLDRSLRPGAMISYQQMIQEKTREFLAQLRSTPKDFEAHVGLLQGKLLMSLTYGYDLKDGDKILEAPLQTTRLMAPLVLPGAALVNHVPILRHVPSWVPYFSYKPVARTVQKLGKRIRDEPIDFVNNALHNGTAVHSMAVEHLRELDSLAGFERQEQEEVIKIVTGSMYHAGSETTASAMTSLFLALVLCPQVQRRAQAELDAVVGRDRLPTFDDRQRLPYIEAFCKELMRWQMVTPIGLPHSSNRDDVYKGYFIPKGQIFYECYRAILHDPELYPEPEEFKPERFLNKDGTVREDPAISLAFGIGKRICPGRHFVDASIFTVASSVLSVFNVTKAKDENGKEIPVEATGFVLRRLFVHPDKFECSILPRDKAAEDLILPNTLS